VPVLESYVGAATAAPIKHVPQTVRSMGAISCSVSSQWPRGLRRGSAAARLLGMLVRIPPAHGCLSFVSVGFCRVVVVRADHSSREVLPNEVCLIVIMKHRQ
jgi:hypothetical protein